MSFFSKLFGFNSEPSAHPVEQPKTDTELIGETKRLMLLMEVKRQAEERSDEDTVNAVLNMTYDGPMPKQKPDGSYTWMPKKNEPASFEEMMNRFKQTSDEKFSDLKKKNPEAKRSKRGAVK